MPPRLLLPRLVLPRLVLPRLLMQPILPRRVLLPRLLQFSWTLALGAQCRTSGCNLQGAVPPRGATSMEPQQPKRTLARHNRATQARSSSAICRIIAWQGSGVYTWQCLLKQSANRAKYLLIGDRALAVVISELRVNGRAVAQELDYCPSRCPMVRRFVAIAAWV